MASEKDSNISIPSTEDLLCSAVSNPLLQTLAGLFGPIGGPIAGIRAIWSAIQRERATEFFRRLEIEANAGIVKLTEETIQSQEFLHRFHITAKAVLSTNRIEKIERFAKLLWNSGTDLSQSRTERYEEFCKILEELSETEFAVLLKLREHGVYRYYSTDESTNAGVGGTGKRLHWDALLDRIADELVIDRQRVNSTINRLPRTGLYEVLIGISGEEMYEGYVTPLFDELLAGIRWPARSGSVK